MPDISICCATYNHEKYLKNALDGMLIQKGDFTMEILLHDDASTDGTQAIIKDYAERYPALIKPLLQTKNQYSKGIPINETFNFSRAQGKYIALCEGDDYWTDEYKLQKQFQYMEEHPGCRFCFSNAQVIDQKTGDTRRFLPYYPQEASVYAKPSKEYGLDEMLALSFIPTASFLFRREDYQTHKDFLTTPFPYGDLRFKLFFTSLGYAKLIDEDCCVYRLNVPQSALSLWALENRAKAYARYLSAIDFLQEMNRRSAGRYQTAFDTAIAGYYDHAIDYLCESRQLHSKDVRAAIRRRPLWKRLHIYLKLFLSEL